MDLASNENVISFVLKINKVKDSQPKVIESIIIQLNIFKQSIIYIIAAVQLLFLFFKNMRIFILNILLSFPVIPKQYDTIITEKIDNNTTIKKEKVHRFVIIYTIIGTSGDNTSTKRILITTFFK